MEYTGFLIDREIAAATKFNERVSAGEVPWVRETDQVLSELKQWVLAGEGKRAYLIDNAIGTEVDTNYMQNTSSACMAIATTRAIMSRLYALQTLFKKPWIDSNFTFVPAWPYFTYHTRIDVDYGYGGCTCTGMMQAINAYGMLTYTEYNGGANVLTDRELVNLGWNNRAKSSAVFTQYSPFAEHHQVVSCIPKTFDAFLGLLDYGIPIALGTGLRMQKNNNGVYVAGGSTAHGMFAWKDKQNGYLWNNDYGDNFGKVSVDTLEQQWKRGIHGNPFGIVNIERKENKD